MTRWKMLRIMPGFELAITADFEATSAVERELVLRLASLLWRLRRATAIESGLFRMQAQELLQFRRSQQGHRRRQTIIDDLCRSAAPTRLAQKEKPSASFGSDRDISAASSHEAGHKDDLTCSFVGLTELPTCPLDRLSRYEARLWRQACQILFALQFTARPKRWTAVRFRSGWQHKRGHLASSRSSPRSCAIEGNHGDAPPADRTACRPVGRAYGRV
ncbi:hypothetical protein Q2941_48645 [Bradyrhizobium sp. UFLA05-153]